MEVAAVLASSRAQSAILHPAAKTPLGGVCSLSVTPSKLHFAAELWGKPSRAVLWARPTDASNVDRRTERRYWSP